MQGAKFLNKKGADMRFLTSKQIRDFEGKVITDLSSSLELIDNAAKACVRELMLFDAICVFCGKGNNGADGYRAARLLKDAGKQVSVVKVFEPKTQECCLLARKCADAGVPIIPFDGLGKISCDAVVDGIFGIGISGELTGIARKAVEYIDTMDAFVLSVDVPSGLDADRGEVCGVCVRADKTVTFTAPKMGMLNNESVDCCGEILVREAGIPVDWELVPKDQPKVILKETAASLLPRRPLLSHKGTFGRLLMITGSPGMMGAASIAAKAAQRSGCGLCYSVVKKGMENIMNIMVPESVVIPVENYDIGELLAAVQGASAILMGCGSGKTLSAEFIGSVLETARCPVVLDADALNALGGRLDILKNKNVVITPHPLEFSRLTGKTVDEIEHNRISLASSVARDCGITVVLKGARTVVAHKNGDAAVSLSATSALARGGSGDVLGGMISSLCAQGIAPGSAAELGVWLHGRSGMICRDRCGAYSTTVSDIIENLKFAFMEAEGHGKLWPDLGRN